MLVYTKERISMKPDEREQYTRKRRVMSLLRSAGLLRKKTKVKMRKRIQRNVEVRMVGDKLVAIVDMSQPPYKLSASGLNWTVATTGGPMPLAEFGYPGYSCIVNIVKDRRRDLVREVLEETGDMQKLGLTTLQDLVECASTWSLGRNPRWLNEEEMKNLSASSSSLTSTADRNGDCSQTETRNTNKTQDSDTSGSAGNTSPGS
jgi:hypothetical protein